MALKFGSRFIFNTGILLITIYFIFNGLSNIFNNDKHATALDMKLMNTESYLTLKYPTKNMQFTKLLPFYATEYNNEPSPFSRTISTLFGLTSLTLGALLFFFEDRDQRKNLAQYLILLCLFDVFVLHVPFVEDKGMNNYSREFKHMQLSLGVTCGLVMIMGMRR